MAGKKADGAGDELLLGRFTFDHSQPLGTGGFASVFHGHDARSNCGVAVKLTTNEIEFEREVHTLQHLQSTDSDAVLRLIEYSAGPDGSPTDIDGTCYIIQELGRTSLAGMLAAEVSRPLKDAAAICRDLLSALAHLHESGFAHCDIKPENLVLSSRGSWALIDLDSARPLGSEMSAHESWVFTERFTPPEMARSLLNDATALTRLHDPNLNECARLEVAQSILREKVEGRVVVEEALDLWSAGATLVEVVSLKAGYKLHSPAFDALFDDPEAERPRDAFFASWLGTAGGDVLPSLPPLLEGSAALIEALLQVDVAKRRALSAKQLLTATPFLRVADGAAGARAAAFKPVAAGGTGGRWYGVTGCTCDGCGLMAFDRRHYCLVCESFDYCTSCYEERHLGRKEHEHPDFECSRDVTRYAWYDSEEEAAEARRLLAAAPPSSSDKATEPTGGTVRWWWAAAIARGISRPLWLLRRLRCSRVAPAEVTV